MGADKEEIRERNNIVEVIGTYVALKQKGRNWQGLCPFHQEKTPSFYVDPITQTFRCFGCSISGDVFRFIERYENMTFVEAAEFLARRAGLTFERKGGSGQKNPPGERERLFEINAAALTFFRRMLDRVPPAKDYLQERGLVYETIQKFQLGYAPDSWDGLTGYLQANRHDLRIAEAAGLVRRGQAGDYYDVFRHRILFPIHDEQERVVGFGGRALGDEPPRYLNTGETPVFAKSKLLYGLPFARRKIASEGKTLLMEGYMDVIAAHQAGFTNAVATLGTSLTEEHAKKLARLAPADPVVLLVYDADNAGIKATLRASEILEKEGVQVRVVRLPAGDDPDSLLKRGESALFQQAIDNAVGRVEYQLERILANADQTTDAGRAKMLLQIVAILASVPTYAERDMHIEKVWRYHPMSAQGPNLAKQQLHTDAVAYAARKRGESPSPPAAKPAALGFAPDSPLRGRERGHIAPRPQRGWGYREGRGDAGHRFNRYERPRPIEPPPPTTAGPTAEERAERELIRALAEPEWRTHVLNRVTANDFLTPLGRQFFEFVSAHQEALREEDADLARLLTRHAEEDFSSTILSLLQEFHALMANVPITEAAVEDYIKTLRLHRREQLKEELKQELAQLLQKPVLTEEDRERVREYQRLLRELKGSARPKGARGE